MREHVTSADPRSSTRRQWIGFGFLALALFMIAVDLSVTAVAVPSIVADLGISADDASLVMTVYLVVASSFIVLMGKVSDLVGAKKAFLTGAIVFAVGSLVTGAAPTFSVLILGRVIQGVVVAVAIPASLSLLNQEFPSGKARVLAFSIWTAVIGSATALGPLIGGLLATYESWRWAFFINIPIMVVAAIGAGIAVRPVAVTLKEKGFDAVGAVLLVAAVALITFGLQEATDLGWWTAKRDTLLGASIPWPFDISATPIMLILGAGLLAVFVILEKHRARRALGVVLELKLFKVKSFTWGTSAAAFMTAAVFGLLLLIPLYCQFILEANPLGAGVTLAPLGIGMAFGGPIVSRLNWPLRKTVLIMLIIQPITTLGLIPLIQPGGEGWWLAPVLVVDGFAWGAAYSILVSMLLADVPKSLSGVAGGTQTAARLLAGAIGSAILTTILLGSVVAQMSSVSGSGLTAKEKAEVTQLFQFSSQL
ncbi:MAG: MFS transporter, partial [Candidatus Nanopelagicales bacterium]|nr:MFS transporter [Candidatus Nanopelagicales bacterium]